MPRQIIKSRCNLLSLSGCSPFVCLNVDFWLRTRLSVYEALSFLQKTTKFYPCTHMVSQTTVSPNSLITIALKWITKYCKFFPKKDHLGVFPLTKKVTLVICVFPSANFPQEKYFTPSNQFFSKKSIFPT